MFEIEYKGYKGSYDVYELYGIYGGYVLGDISKRFSTQKVNKINEVFKEAVEEVIALELKLKLIIGDLYKRGINLDYNKVLDQCGHEYNSIKMFVDIMEV